MARQVEPPSGGIASRILLGIVVARRRVDRPAVRARAWSSPSSGAALLVGAVRGRRLGRPGRPTGRSGLRLRGPWRAIGTPTQRNRHTTFGIVRRSCVPPPAPAAPAPPSSPSASSPRSSPSPATPSRPARRPPPPRDPAPTDAVRTVDFSAARPARVALRRRPARCARPAASASSARRERAARPGRRSHSSRSIPTSLYGDLDGDGRDEAVVRVDVRLRRQRRRGHGAGVVGERAPAPAGRHHHRRPRLGGRRQPLPAGAARRRARRRRACS